MWRAGACLVKLAAALLLALGLPTVAAAQPVLQIAPSSGNAPSVSGTLSGGGWLCTSGVAPAGGATVSGMGVGGSATIGRDGSLSGSFTVRGEPGQRVEVTVTANTICSNARTPLQAIAYFTFAAPPPTATATSRPTFTPVPTATPRPTLTPVPTDTPLPTATALPTDTPRPSATAAPTNAPAATRTPVPTETPQPRANERPTAVATATATPQPSGTAVPTSRAESSPMPTRPAAVAGGEGSLRFIGCLPTPTRVYVEFTPLGRFTEDGNRFAAPTGPATRVDTASVQGAPGTLTFRPPAGVEEGRVYRVAVVVDDPQCSLDARSTSRYWLAGAGKDIRLPLTPSGETVLEVSNNGDKPPTPKPEVKGAFVEFGRPIQYTEVFPTSQFDGWETAVDFFGSTQGRMQRFRWSTDLANASNARLQVSLFPFPADVEEDPFAPPGLIASWPVDCVDCEFVVDLSPLPLPQAKEPAPQTATANKSWLDNLGDVVSSAGQAVGNFFGNLAKAVAGLFGGQQEVAAQPTLKAAPEIAVPASAVNVVANGPPGNSAAKPVNPFVFNTFYFRVVPLAGTEPVGGVSNGVSMHWGGHQPPPNIDVKIAPPTPTPTPAPSAYEVKILSYHGVILPRSCPDGFGGGYIVTQDTWWDKQKPGFAFTTEPVAGNTPYYKAGQLLCEPLPEEPSVLEKIGAWVAGAWNWASEAYADLKAMAISAVGFFIPDALCSDSCVGFFLDAALVSMGIPPDIPNLDQLMNEGLDYLAQQTVAQIGLPPEVLEQTGPYAGMALSAAEAKFKEEAQSKLKDGLQKGVKEMQLSYADSESWLPKGVPVRPNDYQPPAMTVEVTRKQGVPGGEAGCTANVYATLTIDQSKLDNPPPGWENPLKDINQKHALVAGYPYDFFANVSQNSGPDRQLKVPPLTPGASVTIPMAFQPNAYHSGWSPWGSVSTSDYYKAWNLMHELGTVHFAVYGCGGTELDVAAKGTYGAP